MKVAVALATYEGTRFLDAQLASLREQRRPPDQVVISDDGSTDDTLERARRFQREAPFRVDVLSGGGQVGPMRNFLRAAEACDAELIAFCDQDDVWRADKLERCVEAMRRAGVRACIHALDHFREPTPGTRVPAGKTRVPRGTRDGLALAPSYVARGMSMAFRKDVLPLAARLGALWEPRFDAIARARPVALLDHWSHAHDMYALTAARLLGAVTFIPAALARQRIHDRNYSGGPSGWKQAPEVAARFGSGPHVGYLALSHFCRDFAALLEDDRCLGALDPARRDRARAHYLRWAQVWSARGELHRADRPLPARLRELAAIGALGGYLPQRAGGMGLVSLAKDVAAAAGLLGSSA